MVPSESGAVAPGINITWPLASWLGIGWQVTVDAIPMIGRGLVAEW